MDASGPTTTSGGCAAARGTTPQEKAETKTKDQLNEAVRAIFYAPVQVVEILNGTLRARSSPRAGSLAYL